MPNNQNQLKDIDLHQHHYDLRLYELMINNIRSKIKDNVVAVHLTLLASETIEMNGKPPITSPLSGNKQLT